MKIIKNISIALSLSLLLGSALEAQELLRATKPQTKPEVQMNLRPLECAVLFEPKTVRMMKEFSDERGRGLKLELSGDKDIRSFIGDWHNNANEAIPRHLRGGNIYQGLSRKIFTDIIGGDIYEQRMNEYDVSFGIYDATLTVVVNTSTRLMERAELILIKR